MSKRTAFPFPASTWGVTGSGSPHEPARVFRRRRLGLRERRCRGHRPPDRELAGQGDVSERTIVDMARSANSPLHRYSDWDKDVAADNWHLHQAGTMLRSIRVRFGENDRPLTVPAYKIAETQPKSALTRGHNVLHGDSAAAVIKAKAALDELTNWRARYSPFVFVWADFAQAFRGVANQIGEAEDVVNTAALDDRTDVALTELRDCLTAVAA